MKKIIKFLIKIINSLSKNKKIFYYSKNKNNSYGKTAVKSRYNFWCVGNVLDNKDIACGILNNGEVESEETNLFLKVLKSLSREKKVVLFDIGANIGYYSLLSSNFLKEKIEIYSFEPVKTFYDSFVESAKINNFNNIKIYNVGLGEKKEEKKIFLSGTSSSLIQSFNPKETQGKEIVDIVNLDNFIEEEKIPYPDFIKIDVEGYEYKIIENSKKTLETRPIIFMEIISEFKRSYKNKNFFETFKRLEELDYKTYIAKEDKIERFKPNKKIKGIYMFLFLNKKRHSQLINKLDQNEF